MTRWPRILATLIPLHATIVAALQDPQIEPVLVELRLGRLVGRTVPAHRVGDEALIPLLNFLDLAEIRGRQEPNGDLFLIVQPENVEVRFDPTDRRIFVGGAERPLGAADFVVRDNELFVATAVLGELLSLRWQVDWVDLQVVVIDPDDLPIGRRIRREAISAARLGPFVRVQPDGLLRDVPGPVDGVALDYGIQLPSNPGISEGAYGAALGLNVVGGSFETRVQNQGDPRDGDVRVDVSWTGVWRDNPWLAQLRLGDGFASGNHPRALRGIALGNVPFRRPAYIGQLPFTATLGPGWQIEAFRGGRLIAFDSVNAFGQFSLDVPIQYGENPVDFIAYGPFGEVRRFNQTYRVLQDVIPARRFEYAVSAGACREEAPCSATGNVDLRYGLSTRWTINAGIDQFWRDTLPNLVHPYAGITGTITNALGVQVEAVGNALVRGQFRIEPSTRFVFVTEAAAFDTDVEAPFLTAAGRLRQYTAIAELFPLRSRFRNPLSFDASWDLIETTQDRTSSTRIGASVQTGQLRFIPAVRWRRQTVIDGPTSTRTLYGMNLVALPMRQLGPVFGQVTSRAGIELDTPADPLSITAFLSRPLARGVRLQVGGTWLRDQPSTFSIFFAADLPGLRSYTTVERTSSEDWRAVQQVQGSLLYDRAWQRVAFHRGPSVQQSGVSGRVFLDMDQNGRYDPGEYVLPDVQVTVGIQSRRSDERGEFRLWELPAFEPLVATVDTNSLASPLWVPTYEAIEIHTTPNRYTTLNVPVLPGGLVEGRVVLGPEGSETRLPGVVLEFVHLGSGRTRRVAAFSDGSFYLLGVRPGDWEVRVPRGVEERFGATAQPTRFTVRPLLDGESLGGVTVRLLRPAGG